MNALKFKYFILILIFGLQFSVFPQKLSDNFNLEKKKIESLYYQTDQYDIALTLANKLVKMANTEEEKAMALMVKTNVVLFNSSDLNSGEAALPIALEAAKILSKSTNRDMYQTAMMNIAVCYVKRYNPKNEETIWSKSEKYTQLTYQIESDPNQVLSIDFNDNFDDRPATKEEILESIKYTKINLETWEKRGSKAHIMWRNHSLGKYYFALNSNFEEAERYLKIALENCILIKDISFKHTILSLLTLFAYKSKAYQKALFYGNMNLKSCLLEKNEFQELICRDELFSIYKSIGENDIAYKHKDRAFEINEKYLRQNESQKITLMKEKNSALQKQVNLNDALKKADKNRIYLLGIIGLLTLFILAGIFYNGQLRRQNKQIKEAHLRGQTTERQRVAIDLHDNLGSTISSIKYSLEAIDRSKMNADELAVQENLYSLLDKAYNDVRLLSHNLLPEEFEKQGLAETLKTLVRKINKISKIKFELEVSENFGRVDKKVEFELYSICLELVNNIMKHSKATEAMLRLRSATDGKINLIVSDNGIGIFKNDSDGMGMKNIQARVDSIGGTWMVKAVEGEGVVNEIWV